MVQSIEDLLQTFKLTPFVYLSCSKSSSNATFVILYYWRDEIDYAEISGGNWVNTMIFIRPRRLVQASRILLKQKQPQIFGNNKFENIVL